MPKRPTNEQLVARMMRDDPVAQVFIIEAIHRYARSIADTEVATLAANWTTPLIGAHEWHRAAVEIKSAIDNRGR